MIHDFKKNLELSQCNKIKLLRARIRKFYELCFIGLIDIEQPSYEYYQGKQREKDGIDTQISFTDKDVKIQEKIRTEKYWANRQKDVYVELANEYRGGDGWFYKYKNKIDYIGYYWTKDDISEIFFILYNADFFNAVEEAMNKKLGFSPKSHYQTSNGNVGGKTSGYIVPQIHLTDCEVARFRFNNNKFENLCNKQ
jgi:hypothetical protein